MSVIPNVSCHSAPSLTEPNVHKRKKNTVHQAPKRCKSEIPIVLDFMRDQKPLEREIFVRDSILNCSKASHAVWVICNEKSCIPI